MALSKISHAKNTMAGPDFFKAQGWSQRGEQLAKIYEKYIQGLKDNGALDFDDLLLKAVDLLDEATACAQNTPRSSGSSWWTNTRTRTGRSITSSSGCRSAIATWPSSGIPISPSIAGAARICGTSSISSTISPKRRIVKLERNYRSTQIILDAASAVISQNRNRKDKRLWTERKGGDLIKYFRGSDELEEADFITRTAHSGIACVARLHGCRAVPHQRPVARHRRRTDALGPQLPHRGRRAFLRTQGNQGRPGLPEAAHQPAR